MTTTLWTIKIGRQTIRVLLGNPLLEVIGDGSAESPYIIDDIYELQAINGFLPNDAADEITMSLGLTAADVQILATNLFSVGLTASYRLGADIEAAATKKWKDDDGNTVGFRSHRRRVHGIFGWRRFCGAGAFHQSDGRGQCRAVCANENDREQSRRICRERFGRGRGGHSRRGKCRKSSPEEPKMRVFGEFGRQAELLAPAQKSTRESAAWLAHLEAISYPLLG